MHDMKSSHEQTYVENEESQHIQESVQLPLQLPDCEVRRVRLPGRGFGSQWPRGLMISRCPPGSALKLACEVEEPRLTRPRRYTLTGRERLKISTSYNAKLKPLGAAF